MQLVPAVLVIGCSTPETQHPGQPMTSGADTVVTSDQSRLTSSVPARDLAQAVDGERALALSLYRTLAANSDNLFVSPYSVTVALAMTSAGASGPTLSAFEAVLPTGLEPTAFHPAMNDLDRQIQSRGQGAHATDGTPFRLRSVNQLFAQTGYPIQRAFLDTLATDYGSNVRLLDLRAPGAAGEINRWIESATEGKLKEVVGNIDPSTRLMLVDAIDFNAAWAKTFEPRLSRSADFHRLDGRVSPTPMMVAPEMPARTARIAGTEAFELDYQGGEVSLLVLMPALGDLSAFESSLTPDAFAAVEAALRPEALTLTFPKFEILSKADLAPPLSRLGLELAFSDRADFSGISPAEAMHLGSVVHQAYVKVDERGTEAVAATAVGVSATSVPLTRTLVVDRPFVFVIRDRPTGAILFIGRVTNP